MIKKDNPKKLPGTVLAERNKKLMNRIACMSTDRQVRRKISSIEFLANQCNRMAKEENSHIMLNMIRVFRASPFQVA